MDVDVTWADWIWRVLLLYFTVGSGVAVWRHATGIDPSDPDVAQGSRGFRLVITPGLIALWPLVLRNARPAAPNTAHDEPAGRPLPARRFHLAAAILLVAASLAVLAVAWTLRPAELIMLQSAG